MTAVAFVGGARVDPVLLRLPRATWRALPALGMLGAVVLGGWVLGSWLFGPRGALVPLVVAAAAFAPAAVAVGSVQRGIFDVTPSPLRRRLLVAALAVTTPAVLAAWSVLASEAAAAAVSVLFQVIAVSSAVLSAISAAIAVVGLPLGAMRGEVRVASVLRVAAVAALRRPLPPAAALIFGGLVAWAGLSWFGGLLLLAPPLLVVLAVPAAWSAATGLGVALPALVAQRNRTEEGES